MSASTGAPTATGALAAPLPKKALAQHLGRPSLIALATTILLKRKGCYAVLERNNTQLETTDSLAWFAATALEAQRPALALVDFLTDKSRLLGEVGAAIIARQRKALLRVLAEGPCGFEGGPSTANYMAITGASEATATRDLSGLVARGAMLREDERRYARYRANLPLRRASRSTRRGGWLSIRAARQLADLTARTEVDGAYILSFMTLSKFA